MDPFSPASGAIDLSGVAASIETFGSKPLPVAPAGARRGAQKTGFATPLQRARRELRRNRNSCVTATEAAVETCKAFSASSSNMDTVYDNERISAAKAAADKVAQNVAQEAAVESGPVSPPVAMGGYRRSKKSRRKSKAKKARRTRR